MVWQIKFEPKALKELKKLDQPTQKRILNYIQKQISSAQNPRISGKALTGNKQGLWRYRVGDYRIVCQIIDEELIIVVIKVGHRRSVYK